MTALEKVHMLRPASSLLAAVCYTGMPHTSGLAHLASGFFALPFDDIPVFLEVSRV